MDYKEEHLKSSDFITDVVIGFVATIATFTVAKNFSSIF